MTKTLTLDLKHLHESTRQILIICLLAATLVSCSFFEEEVIPILEDNSNSGLTFGNPTNAEESFLSADNFLIDRSQYTVSYNNTKGIPNWVSWHLDRSWIGSAQRSESFLSDKILPSDWDRVTSTDYTGSGFDRGHNCPSADRTRSAEDNEATFFMTNIIPQAPKQNRGPWKELEEFSRDLVFDGNELYITMGNFGIGGEGSRGFREVIGKDERVAVPQYVWKIIVVLPEGDNDLLRVDEQTRVIAVLMENNDIDFDEWYEYRVSVDEIEDAVGYDLLSELPFFVQEALEGKIDDGPV